MPIPLFDTDTPLQKLREPILARIAEVVYGGRFILGPEVAAFEAELAAYVGVQHAVGVANGTDALTIAARAVGVRAGDEVVSRHSPSTRRRRRSRASARAPVFCDVDHDYAQRHRRDGRAA